MKQVDTSSILRSCAVTFDGPACQLWLAGGVDDPELIAFGYPTKGRQAWADQRMAHCD